MVIFLMGAFRPKAPETGLAIFFPSTRNGRQNTRVGVHAKALVIAAKSYIKGCVKNHKRSKDK